MGSKGSNLSVIHPVEPARVEGHPADDDELRKQGNIDNHPDNFEDQPEHKICVEMLRKGLILLGYEIEEKGPFDDLVYHAFLQYHWQHGRVKWDNVYECDDDHEKPLDRIADKYGVFTWKYFEEEHEGEVDHERIIEALSPEYGDELLAEKGADPQRYKPGVAYHYVWVPFSATVEMGEEYQGKELKYKIVNRKNGMLLKEVTI